MTKKHWGWITAGILALVAGYLVTEARNEVVFLCANFAPNDSEQSVIEQLNTANLLRITRKDYPQGSRIVSSSLLHFHLISCTVDVGPNGLVISAKVN